MAPTPEDIRDLRPILTPTHVPDVDLIRGRGQRRRRTRQLVATVGATATALAVGSVAVAMTQTPGAAPPASGHAASASTTPTTPATTLPATVSVQSDGSTGSGYAGSYQERQVMKTLKYKAAWEAEGIKIGRIGVRATSGTPTIAVEVFGNVQRFAEIALDDRDPRVAVIIEPLSQRPTPAVIEPLKGASETKDR